MCVWLFPLSSRELSATPSYPIIVFPFSPFLSVEKKRTPSEKLPAHLFQNSGKDAKQPSQLGTGSPLIRMERGEF